MKKIPFFEKAEIDHFENIAGSKYRKANESNVLDSIKLKPLVNKLNEWVENSIVEGFQAVFDYTWQWSGTFKSYLWIRVYKESSINVPQPKVYYVFGINDCSELYMELNCQRSNYANGTNLPLSGNKIKSFDTYLQKSGYEGKLISSVKLENYDWEKLIRETKEFLWRYESIYDDLLNVVDPQLSNGELEGGIERVESPEKIKSRISETPQFKPANNDFERKAKESRYLGNAGEELVLELERKKLEKAGFTSEEIDKVVKKKDGEGYDIYSFDEKKNSIFIEVKTTTSSSNEPFYISQNEMRFAELNQENYFIYRIFEFSPYPKPSGKMFVWTWKELNNATKKPLQFEVSME